MQRKNLRDEKMFKDDPGTTAPSPRGDSNPEFTQNALLKVFSIEKFGFRAFKL